MSAPDAQWRTPEVGGISGGAGTTTVAYLIGGCDVGVVAADGAQQVDVLVTRTTAVSVGWAIGTAGQMVDAPVMAVVADSGDRWPAVVRQRLAMARDNLGVPVLELGWCAPLAASDNPWELLATSVVAGEKWALPARRFRQDLIAALIEAMSARRGASQPTTPPSSIRRTAS
ncbi:hypothetical protein [Nocardia alni]|uniref:hypothetical protein n=1 Tax=Nocardia alni TaxID=2815723 RepID=UPI001C23510C|nr:hypothetical protein [Nocardia alni]